MTTTQEQFWSGKFGKEYTDRNPHGSKAMNDYYEKNFGISRVQMNADFLGNFDREIKILEVGCNVGSQLEILQEMGFKNLYGIELQYYAVEEAKHRLKNINIIQGSGFDIPFKDNFFDIVYTSGVLIHIAPENYEKIMKEMARCSKKYIWGYEYYAEKTTEIPYRGNTGFLWKANFAKIFTEINPGFKIKSKKLYPYLTEGENGNTDYMYLLEKS
jgi:pseudaminic acid biosynthesis-associated methylase